ncbi:hypothetical protein JTB14_005812 [Gonioctena quinquepunctata]|nr:hypothetical protein JTB14_005812 [Gonioctena quinquepunctata]
MLGSNGLFLLKKWNLNIRNDEVLQVTTADGVPQECLGYLDMPFSLLGQTDELKVLIILSLKHTLILGLVVDFQIKVNFTESAVGLRQQVDTCAVNTIHSSEDLTAAQQMDMPDPYANYVKRAWITQMRCRLLPFYPEIPPDDFRRTNPREALEFLQEYENDQPQLNYPPESLENNALTLEEMKKIYPLIKFFNDMHLTPRKIQKLLSPENNLRLMELLDSFDNIRSEDEA